MDPDVGGNLNNTIFVNAEVHKVGMICATVCLQCLVCTVAVGGCKTLHSFAVFCPQNDSVALHQLTFLHVKVLQVLC